jgi:hypothetical protein
MDVPIGPVRVAGVLGCRGGVAPVTGVTTDQGGDRAAELSRLLAGGVVLYEGRFLDQDRLSQRREAVVPLTVRTDGIWVWSEASGYYLREHGVLPSADLLSHLAEHRDRPAPAYQQLDRIREECAEVAARADRAVRLGHYIRWRGREWRAAAPVFEVSGVLIGYRHPEALAFGFDVASGRLRRVVPRAEFSDSYYVTTEVQVRDEWVQVVGLKDGKYAVAIGDGRLAARLDIPMTEPGVWQRLFAVDEVDKIRETRKLRYDHPRQGPPARAGS